MNSIVRFFFFCSALGGFLAVAFGAFGAHALKARLPTESITIYQTAVQYQFWHALGLGLIALLLLHLPTSAALKYAGALMLVGILLFSGSLYALALSGARTWGMITPLGGLAWLAAWALFAWAILRS